MLFSILRQKFELYASGHKGSLFDLFAVQIRKLLELRKSIIQDQGRGDVPLVHLFLHKLWKLQQIGSYKYHGNVALFVVAKQTVHDYICVETGKVEPHHHHGVVPNEVQLVVLDFFSKYKIAHNIHMLYI